MEKVFTIIPLLNKTDDAEKRYAEFSSLLSTAGATCSGVENCKITKIVPSTFIGKGKLAEIKNFCEETGVETVAFDGELTPSQTLNISESLGGIKVIDRTTLILDIFALSAKSAEGKIQVELAQLKYIYPRLKGKGEALSRLGGGIGTRGPGESKLETDRRHIRRRINYLEARLEELKTRRNAQTERRKRNNALSVALVGYTNTGKSTLLNALTRSDVLSENKLFATLDPTLRKFDLGDYKIILADTVGFIKNVPTSLIEAFKSTLETAACADLDLIVCDAQNEWEEQLKTTTDMLDELNATAPRILVMNKSENITDFSAFPSDAVFVSAIYKKGFDGLINKIKTILAGNFKKLEFFVKYNEINDFMSLKDFAESSDIKYVDDGVAVKLIVKNENASKFERFLR